ncbi:MAG: crosslink repair DNA glycosylase YcaQ family protein [Acidobacteriota bacterium]|nr:crosslink repair DNA glycosylase YcaQ family protein [Acidobacteriota bacterium]
METLTRRQARRLALARAGLLKRRWTDLPRRATGRGVRARQAAQAVIERFGYLQLDTVSVAGARSHALVLLSRIEGFDPQLAEELLEPGEPLFEYWGHEASWIPLDLYPAFEFRRREFQAHPWWGDLVGEHPEVAGRLRQRLEEEGALRSSDLEGSSGGGWWNLKLAKKIATALWSSGEVAIRRRTNFQRHFDLAERVIPEEVRQEPLDEDAGIRTLLLKALDGHGWATTGTLAQTWRLKNRQQQIRRLLAELEEEGRIVPCTVEGSDRPLPGWIRPADLDLAHRLDRVRPRRDQGVLLSPFDPVLWDRQRVQQLFGFEQTLEIFKPAEQRVYGYYCLPVLAGEDLIARFDLKAHRRQGRLEVLASHFEQDEPSPREVEAADGALRRLAESLELEVTGWTRS